MSRLRLTGPESPAVKICGLTRLQDAAAAARAGADYLGMIASEGFARSVPWSQGPAMALETGLPVVAVVVNEPLDRLVELAEATGAHVLQLHGDEPPELLDALRERGPWKLWKCLRVRTEEEVPEGIRSFGSVADGLLLDGWHPEHRGGSGVRFPWDLLEAQRDAFPQSLDFIAAGGLTPENVAQAVRRMRPDIVDVSSGVEIETGIKDPARLRAFIKHAKDQGFPVD